MPTVGRVGRFKIQVFADDHMPPHFHIIGHDIEALVSLRDFTILRGGSYRRELSEALAWARDNIELLWNEWSRLND